MATTNSYYQNRNLDTNFRNVIYALNDAWEEHIAGLLFNGDTDRVIYASTNYSLRERASSNENNNINLPFVNYYTTNIENSNDRMWFSHVGNIEGVYIDELDRNIRFAPIRIDYDCSMWFQSDYDLLWASNQILFDDSNETIIDYYININGQNIKNIGWLEYNLQYKPTYEEQDFLEQNKIFNMKLDITFYTFMIQDNLDVALTEEVIFKFLNTTKDIDDLTDEDYELAEELIIDYFS